MKAILLQRDIKWADPDANILALKNEFDTLPDADIYVLPEMWTTGFATCPEGIAETEGKGLQCMKDLAVAKDAAVAGTIAECIDGKYVNRHYFVTPDNVWYYDKHHLFTYSGEDRHYTAGKNAVVVEWRGVRFRLVTCYDIRFPAWCRNVREAAYDVLVCVASWPESRSAAWKTLIRARAIENQAYVIGVNRIGSDPGNVYSGDSALVDPFGNVSEDIDMEALSAFRKKFPVLEDADKIQLYEKIVVGR